MIPYYADQQVTLYTGDAVEVLRGLPDGAADCVVTSPPYWGLRDYGTGTWSGGDPGCAHAVGRASPATQPTPSAPRNPNSPPPHGGASRTCRLCAAVREDRQYGLEVTPQDYIDTLRAVFAELRRVLTATGTAWLNLGDSYSATPPGRTATRCGPAPWPRTATAPCNTCGTRSKGPAWTGQRRCPART
jgi:DNA modification methylase